MHRPWGWKEACHVLETAGKRGRGRAWLQKRLEPQAGATTEDHASASRVFFFIPGAGGAAQSLRFERVTLAVAGATDSRGRHGSGDTDEMTTGEAQVPGAIPEPERELQAKSSRFRMHLGGEADDTGGVRVS